MKMNDELKAYVNAYMDGLEVEWKAVAGMENWETVHWFEAFDSDGEDDKMFRIKPKAEDKWQRVIDEQPWKQLIKHVERLDDTVTRLALEVAKLQENEDEPTCNDGGIPIPIHRKK